MCGLTGCITKKDARLTPKQYRVRNQVLRGLFLAMEERGHHSTGVASVGVKTHIVKQDMEAKKFVDTEAYNKLLRKNSPIVLGHTRWASSGAITQRNAHPFDYGNIIGCHNGHVSNSKSIFEENKVDDAEVDSEAIFYLLDKYNNDYEKAFEELHGVFAVTWIDLRFPNKVFLVRDGNPLFIMLVPELQTYFWASTEAALKSIIGTFFSLDKKTIWDIKPEEVYEFNTNFQVRKRPVSFKSYITRAKRSFTMEDEEDARAAEEAEEESEMMNPNDEAEIAGIIGAKSSIIPFRDEYFERTGYKNPFSLSDEQKKELDNNNFIDLMDLTIPSMKDIIGKVSDSGCLLCEKPIDFQIDGGVFWHKTEKGLLCPKCRYGLGENKDSVIWIMDQDIEDMYLEIESFEEEQRELMS